MAGEGGLLSKIETGNVNRVMEQDRRVRTEGEDRQASRENTEQLRNRDSNTAQKDKI